jgi:hypothetical protein
MSGIWICCRSFEKSTHRLVESLVRREFLAHFWQASSGRFFFKMLIEYHSKVWISKAILFSSAGRSPHSDAPHQLTTVREDPHRLSFIRTHKDLLRYPMFNKAAGQFL